LVNYRHAGFDNPSSRVQIGASRQAVEQPEFGEQERTRALRRDKLALRIESNSPKQRSVPSELNGFRAATQNDRVGITDRSAFTTTPFIEVTAWAGDVMNALQPLIRNRFRIWATTNESISLKPSKVNTAICMLPCDCGTTR
jgi:hypothetical protein